MRVCWISLPYFVHDFLKTLNQPYQILPFPPSLTSPTVDSWNCTRLFQIWSKSRKSKIGTISFVTVWPSFLSTTLWIFTYASLILDGIGIFRRKILDIFYATIPLIISRKHFTHKYWREFANDSPCPNNDIKMIMWWSMPVNGGAVMSFSHFHSSSSKTKNKLNFILVSRQSREKSNVAKMFQMYH